MELVAVVALAVLVQIHLVLLAVMVARVRHLP
jgi:hypothetical protein